MIKFNALALPAALACAALATPALSEQDDIVVSSDPAIAELSRDLDRELDFAAEMGRVRHGDGFAMIRFERGDDGRPTNVKFYRHSGSSNIDRLARTAVRRLGRGDGLPVIGSGGQTYQANIVLATSEHSLRELSADLASAEKQRRASSAAERNVLALAAGARIAS